MDDRSSWTASGRSLDGTYDCRCSQDFDSNSIISETCHEQDFQDCTRILNPHSTASNVPSYCSSERTLSCHHHYHRHSWSRSRRGQLRRSSTTTTSYGIPPEFHWYEVFESSRTWSIQRVRGRPGRRFHSRPGGRPTNRSTCLRSAMWAGMSFSSRAIMSKDWDATMSCHLEAAVRPGLRAISRRCWRNRTSVYQPTSKHITKHFDGKNFNYLNIAWNVNRD